MLKRLPLFLTVFFLSALTSISAQVEKKVIVEHFTNSRCSVCASRNPDFFANLDNHPDVLHIAIHPSSPYSNCLLNNNNPEENDERTNYYGIYGSTPKLVIQGENIAVNANYGSAELFAPYLEQTSPISMNTNLILNPDNKVAAFVGFNAAIDNEIEGAKLFLAIVEDTVFYEAPNGEDLHFNVLRKVIAGGSNAFVPTGQGEEYSYDTAGFEVGADWNVSRLRAIAILQDGTTKEVIQAATGGFAGTSSTENFTLTDVEIFPNPVQDKLQIIVESGAKTNYRLTDISGKILSNGVFQNEMQLDMNDLVKGIYFIEIENEEGRLTQKIIKE